MASKTRIIILHLKEILFTLLFASLALIIILLFVYMFFAREGPSSDKGSSVPTYTSSVSPTSTDPLFNTDR